MKRYFLTCLILFPFAVASAQSAEEQIADKVCESMSDVDFDMEEEAMNVIVMQSIQEVYKAETDLILEAMAAHIEENPEITQQESAQMVGNAVRFELMGDCENFQRITMFRGKPVPRISDLTRKIGDDINESLTEAEKNGELNRDTIDKVMSDATRKYSAELEEQFGEVYSNEFSDELIAYMQTQSKPYMRWMVRGSR
ncbi:MAG: hypothetical protein WBB45_04595 [Cyclobacteriaceae bacterium]